MTSRWLTLALPLLVAGCFGTHVPTAPGEDAGAPPTVPDAGGGAACEVLPGAVLSIDCIPPTFPGGSAYVDVTSAPAQCCESGSPTVRAERTAPGAHTVSVSWTACSCCAECRCLGPTQTTRVDLGPIGPGLHEVHVEGSSDSCGFAGPPSTCSTVLAEGRMPSHLIEGQQLPITMTAPDAFGCDCAPSVLIFGTGLGGGLTAELQVCDCCEVCDCIDAPYRASTVAAAPVVGTHGVIVGDGVHSVEVHDADACWPLEPSSVEIFGPEPESHTLGGPALYWARVTGPEAFCCGAAAPVARQLFLGSDDIILELLTCRVDPCDCDPPTEVEVSQWVSLGELSAGEHNVFAGDVHAVVSVP